MNPKHQRLLFVCLSVLCVCVSALMILNAFKENIVFFYTPSALPQDTASRKKLMRIGGLVETGSVTHAPDGTTRFTVTDGTAQLYVLYHGMLPSLFRQGQGVVAEGHLTSEHEFTARRVLAKHDETYMPPEVAEALKRSGHWKGGVAMDKQ